MLRHALHAKLHHATVTYCDADYVGSITIDRDLLDASGMRPNEKVLVADCDSAARFETYVIPGERGSGVIGVNGACAIVMSFCMVTDAEFAAHRPKVVIVAPGNRVGQVTDYAAE
ncbi:MAG: aspartate 1-decarboxylase [Actinobacteria bacterium]|nr:aspartate 1-decarboxylase [Actinomycetota bacterium]